MKTLIIKSVIILICGLALLTKINAQEKSNWKGCTYKFEFIQEAKKDSSPTLYCVMKVTDLLDYKKIQISYNDRTKQYVTQSLLKNKSEGIRVEGNFVYFKINEILVEPFVIIEGEDLDGKKYIINERNARGQVINSREEKEKWKKSIGRIDSMDYVRQFDGIYTGKDGKPRFKDKNGKVYIIEKDHLSPE
jgi:hypothetical protein